MRRSLFAIALFSLALAIQAIAPATAALADGAFSGGQICVTPTGAPGVGPLGHGETGPGLCDLCAVCCGGGVPPLAERAEFAGFSPLDWTVAEWTASSRLPLAARPDHARRARAPPFPSA